MNTNPLQMELTTLPLEMLSVGLLGQPLQKTYTASKPRINQLITTQASQCNILVHIVSILNITRYTTQVNRCGINTLMEAVRATSHDINNLYNHTLIPKTAFNSPFGKYEYVKLPFRLAQAPVYFQELMTRILKDFDFATAYLDDIIIFSRTAEEHLLHIRQVFEKL